MGIKNVLYNIRRIRSLYVVDIVYHTWEFKIFLVLKIYFRFLSPSRAIFKAINQGPLHILTINKRAHRHLSISLGKRAGNVEN